MDLSAELGTSISEESLLLNAAQKLNYGSSLITDRWEKLDLAELNFQAAELAAKKSSFFPAIEYVQHGLSQLGDNPWEENYNEMYKLSVALVRIEYCCGLCADCIKTADDVLAHAKDINDRCPVYHAKVLCLVQQEKAREAQNLVLAALEELEMPFPRRFLNFHLLCNILQTDKKMKALSDEDIKSIPEISDERLAMCAGFLERLMELAFLGGDLAYFFLAVSRGFSLMLELGRYPWTLSFFIGWAYSKVVMGDLSEAFRFGNLVLELADGREHAHDSRMKAVFYSYVSHWRLGLRDGIAPCREAIEELWDYGALDSIYQDAQVYYRLLFVCGEPLDYVLHESEKYLECLGDYKQEIQWNFMVPLVQAVANLQGKSRDPLVLTGKYMNEDERQAIWKQSANRPAIFQYQFFVMVLGYHFCEYELAEKTILRMQPLFEDGPDSLVQARVLYTGLVYWARFKITRRRIHRRKANAAQRRLEKWADDGAVSCVPMQLLLIAESMSVASSNSKEKVIRAYDRAIEELGKSGIRHCEALANELAAAFLVRQSDLSISSRYLNAALALYEQWGAEALVADVRRRFRDM